MVCRSFVTISSAPNLLFGIFHLLSKPILSYRLVQKRPVRSFLECLEVCAIKPVIPPKSNRKVKRDCDFALYAERNLVERFFNTIKHFRGIATRHLVCALVWLK